MLFYQLDAYTTAVSSRLRTRNHDSPGANRAHDIVEHLILVELLQCALLDSLEHRLRQSFTPFAFNPELHWTLAVSNHVTLAVTFCRHALMPLNSPLAA